MLEKTATCTLTRYGSERCSYWTVSDDRTGTVRGSYSTEQDARIAASDMGYVEAKPVSKVRHD